MNECILDYDYERPRLLGRIPDGDFVGVTTMDGKRLYMNLKDEKELEREVSIPYWVITDNMNLIPKIKKQR